MSFQFFIPSTLLHVWLLVWNPSFNALHYIFIFQVVSLKSMQFPGDVIVNLAVLLILICWNQCPPHLPKPISCISFWHSCALTSVTLWRSLLSLVWQSDVIELQSLFCVYRAEWMKNHHWVTHESVLNYCICGTFNFEINLCNICDSSSCNVLKFFVRYTGGRPYHWCLFQFEEQSTWQFVHGQMLPTASWMLLLFLATLWHVMIAYSFL